MRTLILPHDLQNRQLNPLTTEGIDECKTWTTFRTGENNSGAFDMEDLRQTLNYLKLSIGKYYLLAGQA